MIEEIALFVGVLLLGSGGSSSTKPCWTIGIDVEEGGTRFRWYAEAKGQQRVVAMLTFGTELEARTDATMYIERELEGTVCGAKLPGKTKPSSTIPEESSCPIRVDVDGRTLAICRVGTRYRMYVEHVLDPRTFADLPGVLQRAVVVANPAAARRITFETSHGTATVLKLDAGGYDWTFTPSDDPTHPQHGGPSATMLDALGDLYAKAGKADFFS